MHHVIDALAADVIITRAQTINRAWDLEGLVNVVQESCAIDWPRALQASVSWTPSLEAWLIGKARYKAKKPTLRADEPTWWTIFASGHTDVDLKRQTNCNKITIHHSFNKYLMNALHQAAINNRVYIVNEPSWRNTPWVHTRDTYVSLEPLNWVCKLT